jgi:hypothetical protein
MATPSFIHFDTKCKGGGQRTPGHRRGGQRTPGRRKGRGPPPTILINIHFDTKCKGGGQ